MVKMTAILHAATPTTPTNLFHRDQWSSGIVYGNQGAGSGELLQAVEDGVLSCSKIGVLKHMVVIVTYV